LINLALAILVEPEIVPMIKQLVHMGGFFELLHFERVPDRPANGWLNTDYDPVASAIVFRSGLKITQIPVDATTQTTIAVEEFQRIVDQGSAEAAFIAKTAIPWTRYIMDTRRYNGSCPHDALAVAFVIDPTLVETEPRYVNLEKLILRHYPYFEKVGSGPAITGAIKVDVTRFKRMLMERYLRK
jgi:purine nucleosidase